MTQTTTRMTTDEVDAVIVELEPDAESASDTRAARRSRSVASVARWGLAGFAGSVVAFVVFALWLSGLSHARAQVGLQRRFNVQLSELSAPVSGKIANGAPVALLRVPSAGINEVVVQGARSHDLQAGPGHVAGTPLPGQPGNAVIAGHRMMYGGPFRNLRSLERGDRIFVTTGQGESTYRVVSTARSYRSGNGSMFGDYGDNRLTLFTADPPLRGTERLAVTAELVELPYAATDLPRTLDAEGLGLTGQRGAVAMALVWLELLMALLFLIVLAVKRWSRWAAWIVFVPALCVVTWILFTHVMQLLPATL